MKKSCHHKTHKEIEFTKNGVVYVQRICDKCDTVLKTSRKVAVNKQQ